MVARVANCNKNRNSASFTFVSTEVPPFPLTLTLPPLLPLILLTPLPLDGKKVFEEAMVMWGVVLMWLWLAVAAVAETRAQ